ncbi:MAG: DUF4190 domain-containing protein [Anaerolineaceae bacterium]|nr:DUF4190 domain-containing protein [Anaerolineaceae bacterium]
MRFPNKCVYCGKPPKRAYKLTVTAQQEVGKVRGIFAQKAYLRTLAGVKTLTSTAHMAVPYCKEHFIAAWVDKWIFRSIEILAWLAGMSMTWFLFLDTFLAEGAWTIILFTISLFGGMALAGITLLVVQRVIGLVYPVINEIPANLFKGEMGVIAGTSRFYKRLFGITLNPKNLSLLEMYLDNPIIASDLLKLNTGTPDEGIDIEVWPEPISMLSSSVLPSIQPQKKSKLATASLVLGLMAAPLDLCVGVGALFGVAALITGGKARRQIRDSGGFVGGQSHATWGMILGGIGVLLGILMIIIIVVV